MPYEVRKSGKGYKVFKKGSSKSFSDKPLSKKKAEAQMAAIYANEKDIEEGFIRRIDDALGIVEGTVTKGPSKGPAKGATSISKGALNSELPKTKKAKKKKAAKIEDEVLEAG